MPYQITSSDTGRTILDRSGAGCASAAFIVVGSIFLCVGIGLNLASDSWEFPNFLIRILFPLFGAGAIFSGIYLPRQMQNTTPQRILFDNDLGVVCIEMTIPSTDTGYIRYDEIKEFDIHLEKRSGDKGRTYYYYHVLVRKKDGGEWFLTEDASEDKAIEKKNKLIAAVNLDAPCRLSASGKLSPKIDKQEGPGKTVIHWQNKVAWWTPLFLFVFAGIFLSILSSVFLSHAADELGVFIYFIIGFILLIFCLVMFSVTRKMIKDYTTRYAVAVGNDQLEYYEFAKSSGTTKNSRAIALNDIININYSFAPVRTYSNAGLSIITKKDIEQLQKNKEKPLDTLKDLFTGKEKAIQLSISALNPVECLQLETWLQELIQAKGGKAQ